ncbi:hypothetical protein ACFYXL_31200, partial [Streptomyces tsukubensis]|uniref:hypothetical protein n=1 Tax=Streptomyces tsukubensis TaxID=83656 RepID=UPI0036B33DAD
IFGTLLSSQGTDASFRPFSPGPPGFPFGLAFPTLPDLFPVPFPVRIFESSGLLKRPFVFRLCLSAVPTLSEAFRPS